MLTLLGVVIDALPRAWRQKYAWTHRPRPPHSAHEASSTRRLISGATACPAPPPAPAPSWRWAALEEVGACARRAAASGGTRWPARARARPGATKSGWPLVSILPRGTWHSMVAHALRSASKCRRVRARKEGARHRRWRAPPAGLLTGSSTCSALPMTWSHGACASDGEGYLPARGSVSPRLPAVANTSVNISPGRGAANGTGPRGSWPPRANTLGAGKSAVGGNPLTPLWAVCAQESAEREVIVRDPAVNHTDLIEAFVTSLVHLLTCVAFTRRIVSRRGLPRQCDATDQTPCCFPPS